MKSWQDDNVKSVRRPGGFDGKRFIVLHAGHKVGFIKNASLVFAGKSKLMDYNGEMNNENFTKWVDNQLIPNLEEPSLILEKNEIPFDKQMFKAELLSLAKLHKKPKKYKIDQLLQANGHEALRLPPYHCQFNAIEMIWADTKHYYNIHISEVGHTDENVLEMWKKAVEKFTPEVCHAKVCHTDKLIQNWYGRKVIIEEMPEPIIHLTNDESDSNESSSESCESLNEKL
ncbi:uncharacterized protein LOC126733516 [Anthonomus grandis grandis]|uniref:uncharacterized protein LOC126733516 n=1 Tax=Anthonomus grandis grandis TaxID=2921223 RepID=UPI0021669A5D|nr:uncharacterized protein LOC126733516 [Anthonomus grandis grandis]